MAFVCTCSLCIALFYHVYADPVIITAIIGTTSLLIGALVTMLSSTKTPAPGSTSTMTTTVPAAPEPSVTPTEPIPVTIENPPNDPANVTEVKT